jgi:hypothetical protein
MGRHGQTLRSFRRAQPPWQAARAEIIASLRQVGLAARRIVSDWVGVQPAGATILPRILPRWQNGLAAQAIGEFGLALPDDHSAILPPTCVFLAECPQGRRDHDRIGHDSPDPE